MSKSADGSERRTAQRRRTRRRATDEKSVEILESMSDGFAAVDREWRYTYVNRAAERNARLRREEMLGRTLWEVFPEFAGSQFESACRRAMDEGVTVHFEEYCAPLDAWFQQTVYPAADGITVYVRDITERKSMEAALDEQQRFIRRITDLSPVMLDVFNVATGSHTYFSSDVANLLGYTADQIARMEDRFSTLSHPEDVPRLRENVERLKRLTDGEINEFECRVRRGDEWRWVSSRSMVFARDERGDVRQVVNATFDVTERKEASEKLRESEERFRSTFELGLIGMAITSPTKGIVEGNDEFCKILGYERDELLKRTWAEMTHPDDLAADTAQFNRVMAGEIDGYKLGKRFIRKDGRIIDTAISVKALRRADGSVDYFVALLEDVTESKRFETLLGAQKRALEMVVGGSPLTEVLAYLASIVERQSANSSIASLMLLDDQGRLHNGAAPSLPADFIQALDGIEADESVGTCSRAAATGEVVITPDIAADPLWQDFKHLPLGVGLQSAWSMPIVAADGSVLGTFGTYFREKREPTGFERQTVEILCGTAALAIQRKRAEEALERAHDELERRVAERTQELTVTLATLREEEERRKELLRRIVFAQEDERRRIARDLHDQFGQQLNVMILHLGMLKEGCGDQPKVREQIAALEANANQLDSDIFHYRNYRKRINIKPMRLVVITYLRA